MLIIIYCYLSYFSDEKHLVLFGQITGSMNLSKETVISKEQTSRKETSDDVLFPWSPADLKTHKFFRVIQLDVFCYFGAATVLKVLPKLFALPFCYRTTPMTYLFIPNICQHKDSSHYQPSGFKTAFRGHNHLKLAFKINNLQQKLNVCSGSHI